MRGEIFELPALAYARSLPAPLSAMSIDTQFQLLKYRRTKIVATLGPSSNKLETIEKLLKSGVNVFRLNLSHGTHETHEELYQTIRKAGVSYKNRYSVLADLSGPKIRVGAFDGGSIDVETDSEVVVTMRDVRGEPGLIPSQYTELANDVVPGDRILLDDGNLEFLVRYAEGTEIYCRVLQGGELKDHKGMNLPGVKVSAPSLTDKDVRDAKFVLDLGIRILALSFVRRAEDVAALRDLVDEAGVEAVIIPKIEKPEALDNIVSILELADGIMIARGDLGVELPPEMVPIAQEQLILEARRQHKPVIVATQMLESMMTHSRPTRAEVSDVSHAVRSGADAIMLSGESAAGQFPVEAVKMMDTIARQTEGHLWAEGAFGGFLKNTEQNPPIPIEHAVAEATAALSRSLRVRCIIIISKQGRSVSVISASRPASPIIGVTFGPRATHLSNLLWGVISQPAEEGREEEEEYDLARRYARELELVSEGHTILLVRGFSDNLRMNNPSVTVLPIFSA